MARRDWIQWVTSGKRAETRTIRIEKTCDMLASGKLNALVPAHNLICVARAMPASWRAEPVLPCAFDADCLPCGVEKVAALCWRSEAHNGARIIAAARSEQNIFGLEAPLARHEGIALAAKRDAAARRVGIQVDAVCAGCAAPASAKSCVP